MSNTERSPAVQFKGLWQSCTGLERDIILYFVYSLPPVSVDTLVSLSEGSAVTVLNTIEKLRKARLVCEKKGHRKGVYFPPNDVSLISIVQECVPDDEVRKAARKVIEYYDQSSHHSEEQTLLLADLYRKFGDGTEGARHIKAAASIMQRSGQKEKALVYYGHLIQSFTNHEPTETTAEDFLDCVIGITSISMYQMPVNEQIPLLTKAQEVAKRYGKLSYLPKIQLYLGRLLQDAGHATKASKCIEEALDILQKTGDTLLLRTASPLISEYFIWKGMFSTATSRYEKMVGNVEGFGKDEAVLMSHQLVGVGHVLCGRIARGLGMIDAVRAKARMLNSQDVAKLCDVLTAVCFLELQKITEAEVYIDKVLSFPEEALGHHLSWIAEDCRAYVLCVRQDYKGAFESLRKAQEHAHFIGRTCNVGPWRFDVLSTLESKNLTSETINFDSELKIALHSDNIYMKGVALRYRALRRIERHESMKDVLDDLTASERYLEQSGAQIQLARTRIALADYYRIQKEEETAQSYIAKALAFLSTIDRDLVPRDLLEFIPEEEKVKFMIERLTRINESLGTIRDTPSFLDRVLNVAMDFTLATRGAFAIPESDDIKILASRNLDPSFFVSDTTRKTRDIVLHAMRNGVELVTPGTGKNEPDAHPSISAPHSILCMPAKLGETIMGYLCLDNRLGNKPFSVDEIPFLRMLCSQIAVGLSDIKLYEELKEQRDRFEDETIYYKREMGVSKSTQESTPVIVGDSDGIKAVLTQIRHVASAGSSVLILGETGVGKELVAKAIHNLSKNANGPFISVNLATLPQELVASELFGHEKGAFTGAHQQLKGRFELADGGTIFLDEIGDTPPNMQVKLLRVLQEGTFERLGSTRPMKSNFLLIAATNKDLRKEVANKTFREDLYYRLNVFPIHVPPLRERKDDIPRLTQYFLEKFNKKFGKQIKRIPGEEMEKLISYRWPGNVRELEHVVERAVVLSDGRSISFLDLRPSSWQTTSVTLTADSLTLSDAIQRHVEEVLNITRWKVRGPGGAAGILGLKPTTLFSLMKRHGIERPH